ncbi:hypothetical protein BZZ01_02395 [Nostocales cyanobacterium HT-58-2]|nr:hypothetical protein BZZ01_02395 [Nostocales cyanobacterium HT-58-2]
MFSSKQKEELFHTALVKYGIDYYKAGTVAKILASGKPDELLTDKEIQLSKEVCSDWLKQHKRLASIVRESGRFIEHKQRKLSMSHTQWREKGEVPTITENRILPFPIFNSSANC